MGHRVEAWSSTNDCFSPFTKLLLRSERAQNSIQNDSHSQRCNLAAEPPIFTGFAPYATSWTVASATCVNHVSEVTRLVWEEFVWQPEVLRKCVAMRLPRCTKKFQFTTFCPCGQRNETPVDVTHQLQSIICDLRHEMWLHRCNDEGDKLTGCCIASGHLLWSDNM